MSFLAWACHPPLHAPLHHCHSFRQDIHPNLSAGSSSLPSCSSSMGPRAAPKSSLPPPLAALTVLPCFFVFSALSSPSYWPPAGPCESKALVISPTTACPSLAQCLACAIEDRSRPAEDSGQERISCPKEQVWCSLVWRGLGWTAREAEWKRMWKSGGEWGKHVR